LESIIINSSLELLMARQVILI